jgi:long-chain acyl-CoA synthetase
MIESLHSYKNTENFSEELAFVNFHELLDSIANRNDLFYSSYDNFDKFEESFSSFYNKMSRFSNYLKNHKNIKQGEFVAVQMGNHHDLFVVYAAILYIGAVVVPIVSNENKKILSNIKANSKIKLLINKIPENLLDYSHYRGDKPTINLNSPGALFYTSGTTGASKGVLLSIGNLLINSEATKRTLQLSRDTTLMTVLPFYHVNAFNFSFITPLYLGCRIVFQENFFPINFWNIISSEKVNIVSIVPRIANILIEDRRKLETPNENLKYFISAAASLSKDTLQKFIKKFKKTIYQAYGLSETVNFSLMNPPLLSKEAFDSIMFNESRPSAGSPVYGNNVVVKCQQTGEILKEGEIGEICISGWNLMLGYHNNKEQTDKCIFDNVFHTGDLGYYKEFEEKKYFYLSGRIKEIVKKNGHLTYLEELDHLIQEIPGLGSSVSVAIHYEDLTEDIGLYYVPLNKKLTTEEITTLLKRDLPKHKRPVTIVVGEKLPETSTFKLKRSELNKFFKNK